MNTIVMEKEEKNDGAKSHSVRWAAYHGHVDVVRYLVERCHVEPRADSDYSLRYAARDQREVHGLLCVAGDEHDCTSRRDGLEASPGRTDGPRCRRVQHQRNAACRQRT